eukprot:8621742-Alexandrium_andersonii.AAC.1
MDFGSAALSHEGRTALESKSTGPRSRSLQPSSFICRCCSSPRPSPFARRPAHESPGLMQTRLG